MQHKSVLKLVTSLLVATALTACGGGNDKKQESNNEVKTAAAKSFKLKYCLPDTFDNIDPGATSLALDAIHIESVFDGLFGFKKGTAVVEPALVESYEASADGKVYTFHLRHGVKFHKTAYFTPSREFNADDLIFTFARQMDTKGPFYRIKYAMIKSTGVPSALEKMEKIDDYTVKFHLKQPMATFINSLSATYVFGVVSKEYHEKMLAEGKLEFLHTHPIGTGAWIYADTRKGEYTRFIANKDYWRVKPNPSALILKAVTDPSQYLNAVESGECDITYTVSSADVANAKKYNNVKLINRDVLRTWHTNVNLKTYKEYDNPLVMQAIAYAINKEDIINQAFLGQGKPATSLIPPGMFAHLGEEFKQFKYNPAKAKKLLAKAGHPGGKGLRELEYLIRAQKPEYRSLALILQSNLAEVGIKLKLTTLEWTTMIGRMRQGNYGMISLSWGADYPDPDNFYSSLIGKYGTTANYAQWKNDRFAQLRLKAQTIGDPNKRLEIYRKMSKIYAKYMPVVPLLYAKESMSYNKHIHGYYVNPIGMTDALPEVTRDD